jgi:hypothetical protein
MNIQRRRKPDTGRTIRLFSVAAVLCLSVGAYSLWVSVRSKNPTVLACVGPILLFFGVAIIPGILWQIFWPGSSRNRFRQSSDIKPARIIDRHKERMRVSLKDMPGDELGCVLGLMAVLISRVIPIYIHE